MCIDDNFLEKTNNPKMGEIVTASQCPIYDSAYDIQEYLIDFDGVRQSFHKSNFAPLSDIDETELVKERENQLINI